MDPSTKLKQLSDEAKLKAKIKHGVAPKIYLRSAVQLENQARSYYEEEDWVPCYILSVRFCHLVLYELPAHPGYKMVSNEERIKTRQIVKVMMARAEESKEKLEEIFKAEYDKKQREEEIQQRREEELQREQQIREEQRLTELRIVEEERRKLEQKRKNDISTSALITSQCDSTTLPIVTSSLPNVTSSLPNVTSSDTSVQKDGHHDNSQLPFGYVPLNQPHFVPSSDHVIHPGGVSPVVDRSSKPAHLMQQDPHPLAHVRSLDTPPQPIVDRTTKPQLHDDDVRIADVYLKGIATLQATGGLRMLQVPHNIDHDFLQHASSNTRRNVETCGTLAGKLSRNVLKITHLIIPRQEGTSDSCVTLKEEELLEALEKHDLISVGWIHTHPSQTSFLSSIDMHMQFSYQVMLEEAIAIVVAPKFSQVGYYSLTNHGLDTIGNCQLSGFHPHAKYPPLYEDCKHVQLDPTTSVAVLDLRR